jgi:hypothetical protein
VGSKQVRNVCVRFEVAVAVIMKFGVWGVMLCCLPDRHQQF